MHFDALTLACLADELEQAIVGGRVQQIVLVDEFSVGLEIYAERQRRYLLLSAKPTAGRIYLSSQKLRRGVEQQTPILLLLRKYVRSSKITSVEQRDPTERVLRINFNHTVHGPTALIAEPMGRSANLILVDGDDLILEAVRRVHADRGRAVLPGHPYSAPPPQSKAPPVDDGSGDYYSRITVVTESDERLWKALVANVAGISPSQAREVAWRVAGDINAPAAGTNLLAIIEALQTLWQPVQSGEWQPGTWREDGQIVGFSAYPAHVRGEFEATQSISLPLESFYAARREKQADAYAAQRGEVAKLLRTAIKRVQRQLIGLANDEPEPGEIDRLRMEAEWLLAMSSQIDDGQDVLKIDLGDETLTIQLDPKRSPVEQAERQFQRARKLERAATIVPRRRAKLTQDLAYLEQLQHDLSMAESQPEIAYVRQEVRGMKLISHQQQRKRKQPKSVAGQPLRYVSGSDFEIVVGKNARQNERVTFDIAHGNDLWLHARGVPGAHVIIRRRGAEIDEETVSAAAQLAAHFSKARGERNAEVIVAPRRSVSRIPGGRPGQVTVRNERTVTVTAELPDSVEKSG